MPSTIKYQVYEQARQNGKSDIYTLRIEQLERGLDGLRTPPPPFFIINGAPEPEMLNEELSTDMDRITQLQDAILDLLTITSTSIEYITKRTQFEQTSTAIPTTLQTPHAASRADYKASIETFVADIIRRSKDIKTLIAALPRKDDSAGRAQRLTELQEEMKTANEEYKAALAQSEELLIELQSALNEALGQGEDQDPVSIPTKLGSEEGVVIDGTHDEGIEVEE